MVRFTGVNLKPLVVASSTDNEGIIRRFRAVMKGEYFYPVVVDRKPFKKTGRRRKKDEKNDSGIVVWDGVSDEIPGDTKIVDSDPVYRTGAIEYRSTHPLTGGEISGRSGLSPTASGLPNPTRSELAQDEREGDTIAYPGNVPHRTFRRPPLGPLRVSVIKSN